MGYIKRTDKRNMTVDNTIILPLGTVKFQTVNSDSALKVISEQTITPLNVKETPFIVRSVEILSLRQINDLTKQLLKFRSKLLIKRIKEFKGDKYFRDKLKRAVVNLNGAAKNLDINCNINPGLLIETDTKQEDTCKV
jgi:hypothetical protein